MRDFGLRFLVGFTVGDEADGRSWRASEGASEACANRARFDCCTSGKGDKRLEVFCDTVRVMDEAAEWCERPRECVWRECCPILMPRPREGDCGGFDILDARDKFCGLRFVYKVPARPRNVPLPFLRGGAVVSLIIGTFVAPFRLSRLSLGWVSSPLGTLGCIIAVRLLWFAR